MRHHDLLTTLRIVPLLLAFAGPALAQQAVFVVRHAERADSGTAAAGAMSTDPDLSAAGHARAQALADMLEDAGVTAIFVTQYKRTQQTAAPLANRLRLQPIVVDARDAQALFAQVNAEKGNVLVVGHSNTVGSTISGLGVNEKITLGEHDYDNLFVVVRGEKPALLRLHFR